MVTAMKRYIFFLLVLILIVTETSASIIKGQVLANGNPITAEYTVLTNNTVGLGSGHNASISQYTSGRITVPSKITSGGKTYNVTQIMPLAFRLCDKVRVVIIREGTTRIGDFAFAGCSHLVEVELPSTTQSIGTGVFCDLPKLVAVLCKAVTPPAWEYKDVCTGSENASLFVPVGADTAYKNAKYTKPELGWTKPEGWGTAFQNIRGSAMEGYRIYSQDDLYELRKAINNPGTYGEVKNIYLEGDIDMSDYSDWTTPIADTEAHAFTGTFYGQGHCIRNMKVVSNSVSGLFGYYKGPKITGVRLVDCDFRGKQLAGGLVGQCGACTIDSCYVSAFVGTDGTGGGIVGRTTGHVVFDRCVSHGTNHTFTPSSSINPCIAGIVGSTTGAIITNSAVIKSFNLGDRSGVFVGECTNGGTAIIDYCYATNSELHTLPTFASGIMYGNHIILHGQPLSILDYAGEKHDFTYDWVHFQTVYPAAVLGLDAWAYNNGEYPLPDCFADLWPTKPNHAVYGSPTLAEQSINVLTPDEDIPASAWLDLSDMGFRHYRFKASQLWIDGNMDVYGKAEQLPLGLSKQITVENGILLEDTLYAGKQGTVQYKEPVYELDEQNNFVLDGDGNMICIDSLYLFDKIVWEEKVYSLCLPYNVSLSGNCTLYQPTQIYDVDGETTALFEAVRENYVEAFRPYLVVVHNDTVPLGTRAKVICPELDSKTMLLGDYVFEGTMTQKGNITARENNIYMLEDKSHWLLFKESGDIHSGVESFTAFFRALGKTPATRIKIVLDDDNPVISVGDFYYAIHTEDEENITATLMGYHGRGGNVVVPATAPYVLYGQKQEVPLIDLAPDIFTRSTAEVWSIDLNQCANLTPVTIDRTAPGNPFYKVDERTIIYMPEGKAQAGKNNVIGTECQELTITDGWDFVPPYNFHAHKASYDRILYAAKQQDGSYKSMTYTLCLPFTIDLTQEHVDGKVQVYLPYFLIDDKELLFSNEISLINAGQARVVKVIKESVALSATDVEIKVLPEKEWEIPNWNEDLPYTGSWQGTFARIDNEEAALMNAYTLNNNGKWYRIRSEEGRYRNAWVGAFRAYYTPFDSPTRNNYSSVFKQWVAGDEEDPITPFPSDFFTADTDFTNYVDGETSIDNIQRSMLNDQSDAWFTLDGRRLDGKPNTKGLYLYKGKKIVIK